MHQVYGGELGQGKQGVSFLQQTKGDQGVEKQLGCPAVCTDGGGKGWRAELLVVEGIEHSQADSDLDSAGLQVSTSKAGQERIVHPVNQIRSIIR